VGNILFPKERVLFDEMPFINEFFKKFAQYHIASLMHFYFKYNQQILHQASQDMTTFWVSNISLIKNITLL